MYRFKRVTGNFRYWHTPMLLKVGGVNQPRVETQQHWDLQNYLVAVISTPV